MRSDAAGSLLRPSFLAASPAEFKRFEDRAVRRAGDHGAQPPGQIWVICALTADVKAGGRIHVDGKGLLLGGGNLIGFTANFSVFATLICEAVAPFIERSTNAVAGVALEPNGDFRIDDVLVPAPPADCASPVLLIRRVAPPTSPWFAAGIPKQD